MKRKTVTVVMLLCLALGFAVFAAACTENNFVGKREAASKFYCLDIESMSGSDIHNMELNKGDTLVILFETEKGSLHMEEEHLTDRCCMKAAAGRQRILP